MRERVIVVILSVSSGFRDYWQLTIDSERLFNTFYCATGLIFEKMQNYQLRIGASFCE